MVASVTAVRKRLTTAWGTQKPPQAIIAACEEAGERAWHERVLTPMTPVPLAHSRRRP